MIGEVACQGETLVGSRPDCPVHLPDPAIAAEQALIASDEEGWYIVQLDPHNEMHVNGTLVSERARLHHRDEIAIGEFELRAYVVDAEAPSMAPRVDREKVANLTRFVQFSLPTGSIIKKPEENLVLSPQQTTRLGPADQRVAQAATVEQLMDGLLKAMFESFSAHRVWVGIRRVNYGAMEYQEGRLANGQAADLPEVGDKLKPRVLDRAQFVRLPPGAGHEGSGALAGPLLGPEGPLGMVYVEAGDPARQLPGSDLDYFVVLTNLCAAHLHAIFLETARQRAATMEGEVSVAHAIQARLTPRKLPQWESLQWGAFREPGRERSSDVYDILRLSNQSAALMLAHTSATGPMPSMLMAQAQATFRAACMHLDSPAVFMKMMNHVLYDGQPDHPLDCFAGLIDPASGELKFSVAGHIGAYIIGARGEERRLGGESATPPLGIEKSPQYVLLSEQLDTGETLVLFTPGVTTARNRQGEVFGEERFINILCDGFGQLASAMLKEMLSDLQGFTEGGLQPDDITVLMAHRP